MAPHLAFLDQKITDTISGRNKSRRLIVSMPVRHGKSLLCSKYLPAWFIGTYPDKRVILTSYEADFAAEWGGAARDLLKDHGKLFGEDVKVNPGSSSTSKWNLLGREGGMQTAGVGGPITGKGADLLIVDDPVKNAEEANSETYREKAWQWWLSTAYTRLEPNGAAIIIMTRWHQDDLVGRILQNEKDGGEHWEHVSIPAIAEDNDPLGRAPGEPLWPERWPIERLRQKEIDIGPYWWSALYKQQPIQSGGAEFPSEYFEDHIWANGWPDRFEDSAAACDPSKGKNTKKGDYAATVFVGETQGMVWVDAIMDRIPAPEIVRRGIAFCATHRPNSFGVEGNAFQELLAPLFEQEAREQGVIVSPMLIHNHIDKRIRVSRLGPFLANKRIRFRNTPGCRLLVQQLKDFPLGMHDDGPDALEMAIRLLSYGKQVSPDEIDERIYV